MQCVCQTYLNVTKLNSTKVGNNIAKPLNLIIAFNWFEMEYRIDIYLIDGYYKVIICNKPTRTIVILSFILPFFFFILCPGWKKSLVKRTRFSYPHTLRARFFAVFNYNNLLSTQFAWHFKYTKKRGNNTISSCSRDEHFVFAVNFSIRPASGLSNTCQQH